MIKTIGMIGVAILGIAFVVWYQVITIQMYKRFKDTLYLWILAFVDLLGAFMIMIILG